MNGWVEVETIDRHGWKDGEYLQFDSELAWVEELLQKPDLYKDYW